MRSRLALFLFAAAGASAAAINARDDGLANATSESTGNPSSEHNQICVKYSESGPDNVEDVTQWLQNWVDGGPDKYDYSSSTRNGGYMPATLQKYFDIPKKAFDCPGPLVTNGKAQACVVATEDYCFTGHGSLSDLQSAWAVLNLVARYQKSRMIVEAMFTMSLIPPKDHGKGLAADFAGLLKDFYNGAHGDRKLQNAQMLHAAAGAFLFAPHGLGKNLHLWREVSKALAVFGPPNAPLNCTYFDLMKSTDCITKPGFAAVFKHWYTSSPENAKYLNYIEVIREMSTYTVPYQTDANLLTQQFDLYRGFFLRTMFTRIQEAQGLFIHLQPYDLVPTADQVDDFKSYWGVFCSAIVTSMAGSWCKDSKTNGSDSKAYYPVQISANQNGSVTFDYPAWTNLADYKWDGHVIMGQSNRCADLRSQSFDMKDPYPDIFDVFFKQEDAAAFVDSIDPDHVDFKDCLWNIPILEFSDGPHYTGMDKAEDTANEIGLRIGGAPLRIQSDRTQWKDAAPRSEQLWDLIRNSDYCPYHPDVSFAGDPVEGLKNVAYVMKKVFGWGEVESDDQLVADVFGAQQLAPAGTPIADAFEQLHQAVCTKATEDSLTVIMKELVDIMINIAAFAITAGVPILSLILGSAEAAIDQTLADDFWLQPWVDGVLRQEFTLGGDAATEIKDYLSPHFSTNKVGDGE